MSIADLPELAPPDEPEKWVLCRGEGVFVFADGRQLRDCARGGEVSADDVVWNPDRKRWFRVAELQDISALLPPPIKRPDPEWQVDFFARIASERLTYFRFMAEGHQRVAGAFTRTIVTLSAGAIALSVTIAAAFGFAGPTERLIWAWGSFICSIALVLIGHLLDIHSFRLAFRNQGKLIKAELKQHEATFRLDEQEVRDELREQTRKLAKESDAKINRRNRIGDWLSAGSLLFFLIGIYWLLAFSLDLILEQSFA